MNTVTLKPGHKTSELWLAVLVILGQVLAAAADWLPPRYASWGSALVAIGYILSRGLAKVNPPKEVEPVNPPPAK